MKNLWTATAAEIDADGLLAFLKLRQPEGLNLEYKERLDPRHDRPIESIAAMANTYGGVLLIGVAEERGLPTTDPPGVELGERDRLVNRCLGLLEPPFAPEVIPVALPQNDRYVLVVRVNWGAADRPLVFRGRVPVRSEGRNVPADRYRMASLFAEQPGTAVVPNLAGGGVWSPRSTHSLLRSDERGLIVRLLVSGRLAPGASDYLFSETRSLFAEVIQDSPLDRWIAAEEYLADKDAPPEAWRRGEYCTSPVETIQRRPIVAVGEGSEINAQAVLALPSGVHLAAWLTLVLDLLVKHRESKEGNTAGQFPYRLTLTSLYELMHVLLATAVDWVVPAVFPSTLGVPVPELVGPAVHLDTNTQNLGVYVSLEQQMISRDSAGASFETRTGVDPLDSDERDELVKGWLRRMLFNRGSPDPDVHLAKLHPSEIAVLQSHKPQ